MSNLHNRRRHDYRPKTLRNLWQFAENAATTARWRLFDFAESVFFIFQVLGWIALGLLAVYVLGFLFGG